MHPVVAIDATHLKNRFKGVLFVTVCKDPNKCVYLISFGIGHVEKQDLWTWFHMKLCREGGCHENTIFIFYQHVDIK